MEINEGSIDRGLRIVVGVVLTGLAMAGRIGPWGYLGVVLLVTGAVGVCPLYSLLRIRTGTAPKS